MLGGTYIVETVFSYPGIGTLAYESARYKDYNLLMLLCLMSGIVVILCNMAAQIINERIDPRMREKEGRNIGGNDAVTEKTQLFQFAGERPAEKTEAEKRKMVSWDRPVVAELFLGLLVLGCLFCRQIMTKDPSYMDLKNCSVMPCREFLFGTDTMGRDIFSMIWYGGRISLAIGLLSTLISTVIAVLFGAVSGCAPAWPLDAASDAADRDLLSVPNLSSLSFFFWPLRENPM